MLARGDPVVVSSRRRVVLGRSPGGESLPPSAAGRRQDETTIGQKVAPRSPKERGAGDCCPGVLMSFCRLAGLRGKSSPICGRSTTGRNDDRTKGRAPIVEGTRGGRLLSWGPDVLLSIGRVPGEDFPHPRPVDDRTKRRQDKRSRPGRRRIEGAERSERRRAPARRTPRQAPSRGEAPSREAWPEIRHSNWRNRSKSAISDGGFSLTTNGFRGRMPTS